MSGLPDDLNPRFWPWVEGDTRRDPEREDGPTLADAWFDPKVFAWRQKEIAAAMEAEWRRREQALEAEGER